MLSSIWRRVFGRGSPSFPQAGLQGPDGDIVIIIIGPTGSGKSRFINEIVGSEVAKVGHGLSTCTQKIEAHDYTLPLDATPYGGRTVYLVDTPGFDDTAMHESTRVVQLLTQWLAEYPKSKHGGTSGKKPQVAGFVYLQDITQRRVSNRQNIDFLRLQQLSDAGGDSYSKLVLATYQWPSNKGTERYKQCVEREKELQGNFWKDLIEKGAKMMRAEDPGDDAKSIVVEVLKNPSLVFP